MIDLEALTVKKILSTFVCIVTMFITLFVLSVMTAEKYISNIKTYVLILIWYLVVYLLCMLIVYKLDVKIGKYQDCVLAFLWAICGGIWYVKAYFEEVKTWPYQPNAYVRHNISPVIYFSILVVFTALVYYISKRNMGLTNNIVRLLLSAFFCVLSAMLMYMPNYYTGNIGELNHVNAYVNSLITVINSAPYDWGCTSIYGHYALIYYIPIKLLMTFGINEWMAITTVIAFFGLIMFVAECVTMNKLIQNDVFFVLAVLANFSINMQIFSSNYYQLMPHRLLFPAIMACFLSINERLNGKKVVILGWIICTLAIVWNIEIGVVVTFGYYCVHLVCRLNDNHCVLGDNLFWKISLIDAFSGVSNFIGAYILVNIYNIVVGGSWNSLLLFIYPIKSSKLYNINNLRLPIPLPYIGYFLVICLFMGFVCWNIDRILKFDLDYSVLIVCGIAVIGLGSFAYYMNRTVHGNMSIVAFEFVIVLVFVLEKMQINNDNVAFKLLKSKSVLTCMFVLVLVSMALSAISSISSALLEHTEKQWNLISRDENLIYIEGIIPDLENEDQIGIYGPHSGAIAASLSRNTNIDMIDFEDLNVPGRRRLISIVEGKNFEYLFITGEVDEDLLPEQYASGKYKCIFSDGLYRLYQSNN